jgi:hypothetical protein
MADKFVRMPVLPSAGMQLADNRTMAWTYTGKYLAPAVEQSAATPEYPQVAGSRLKTVSAYS